jgi:hypothetical protein
MSSFSSAALLREAEYIAANMGGGIFSPISNDAAKKLVALLFELAKRQHEIDTRLAESQAGLPTLKRPS